MNAPQRSRVARGRLYLIPSLLGVVPPETVLPRRTIEIARGLAHFVVETPKAARQFLKTLAPDRALQSIALGELNEHTPADRVTELLAPALNGDDLDGLVRNYAANTGPREEIFERRVRAGQAHFSEQDSLIDIGSQRRASTGCHERPS